MELGAQLSYEARLGFPATISGKEYKGTQRHKGTMDNCSSSLVFSGVTCRCVWVHLTPGGDGSSFLHKRGGRQALCPRLGWSLLLLF